MPACQPLLRPLLRPRVRALLALLALLLLPACREAAAPSGSEPAVAVPPALTVTTDQAVGGGATTIAVPPLPVSAAEPAATASAPAGSEPTAPVAAITAPVRPLPTLPVAPAPVQARATAPPAIAAKGAILLDAASGAVLYEKEGRTPLPPASTTKIMTALLALERGNLDTVITVALDDRRYWGSAMGLVEGDRFTLRDLLYGLLLPSGNDAAYVIATALAPSEAAFADLMNQRMAELGLTDSVFRNASGLGRETANLVSPFDMAHLARFALTRADFAALVNTRCYTARGSRVLGMCNGNELLSRYPGADGVKIGWGGRFGGMTVVGSAVRDGRRLIVALFDTPDRPGESAALLNWGFSSFSWGDQ